MFTLPTTDLYGHQRCIFLNKFKDAIKIGTGIFLQVLLTVAGSPARVDT